MFRVFIIIAVASLEVRASQFKFSIKNDLKARGELKREKWTDVEIMNLPKNDCATATAKVPLSIPYSDVSVFLANDDKEILEVHLNKTVLGKFYAFPHKLEKQMIGQNSTVVETDKFQQISVSFPKSWLPDNCTKASAAVTDADGNIYNYYSLSNFQISIPDLLVLEEYKHSSPST